jgi:hypothetical protein
MCNQTQTLVILVISLGTAQAVQSGQEATRPTEYEATISRIRELGQVQGLSNSARNERLLSLETLGEEARSTLGRKDAEAYARVSLALAQELASRDFRDPRQYWLSEKFAQAALAHVDAIPLPLECDLVRHLRLRCDESGKAASGALWARLRKEQVGFHLHAWRRIVKTIDPAWDPEDLPAINVAPPEGGSMAGIEPAAIRDPVARAKYQAEIDANNRKIVRCWEQIEARDLLRTWVPGAERYIILAYMDAPSAKEELASLLGEYGVESAAQEMILLAVEKKKMPEELILRNTTRPAQPKEKAPGHDGEGVRR